VTLPPMPIPGLFRRGALLLCLLPRLQAVEKIGGALRAGGAAEDGALVFLQHLEPMVKIRGVVVPDLRYRASV